MYKNLIVVTIVAVFFLIWVGAVVRSTGSGMGCPDWPECFGSVIPPAEEDLREDYVEFFQEIRVKKNTRLTKLFQIMGLENVLEDKQEGHTTYEAVYYDPVKAWIEYLNRVVGVIVGFLVLGCFLGSFKNSKSDKSIIGWSFLALIVLLMEAFLGSIVVSTNLFPGLISLHMVLAIVLLFILLFINRKIQPISEAEKVTFPKDVTTFSVVVLIGSFIQLFLGIDIREQVDYLHNEKSIFTDIIEHLNLTFHIHRTFSLVLVLLNILLLFRISRYGLNNSGSRWILPIIFIEIFTGVTLASFDLPKISQSFHLLLATLLIGMQFFNLLYVKFVEQKK